VSESDSPIHPLHSGAWLQLQRIAKRVQGFRYLIAEYNDPTYRDRLIAHHLKQQGVGQLSASQSLTQFSDFEALLAEQCQLFPTLHLTELEQCQAWQAPFFQGLNYHRERIAELCPSLLVIWLTPLGINQLARGAADFWSWRSSTLDFTETKEASVLEVTPNNLGMASYLGQASAKERRKRIEEISNFLQRHKVQDRGHADLLLEQGRLFSSLGRYTDALSALTSARAVYRQLDDQLDLATVLGEIAHIKTDQGDINQALDLHHEALRIFEELGDLRERAVTLGDIARIRLEEGEIETAVRLQGERLAVNRNLGAKDGIAAALFDLANIALAQQAFEEAYRLLNESYPLLLELGRLDGIVFVGATYGQLQLAFGERDAGLVTLERSREGAERLGLTDVARQLAQLLEQVRGQVGGLEE